MSPQIDESRLIAATTRMLASGNWNWADDAACASQAPAVDAYFPDHGCPPANALALCLSCPVAMECLGTALVHEARDGLRNGWWGGLGPDEREMVAERVSMRATAARREVRRAAEAARRLRAQRRTVPSIAAELGCTERTVYRYLADAAA